MKMTQKQFDFLVEKGTIEKDADLAALGIEIVADNALITEEQQAMVNNLVVATKTKVKDEMKNLQHLASDNEALVTQMATITAEFEELKAKSEQEKHAFEVAKVRTEFKDLLIANNVHDATANLISSSLELKAIAEFTQEKIDALPKKSQNPADLYNEGSTGGGAGDDVTYAAKALEILKSRGKIKGE